MKYHGSLVNTQRGHRPHSAKRKWCNSEAGSGLKLTRNVEAWAKSNDMAAVNPGRGRESWQSGSSPMEL